MCVLLPPASCLSDVYVYMCTTKEAKRREGKLGILHFSLSLSLKTCLWAFGLVVVSFELKSVCVVGIRMVAAHLLPDLFTLLGTKSVTCVAFLLLLCC